MSAPEPDIEVQTRRHIGPLVGMAIAVLFSGLLFLAWMLYEVDVPDEALPDEQDVAPVTEPAPAGTTTPATED